MTASLATPWHSVTILLYERRLYVFNPELPVVGPPSVVVDGVARRPRLKDVPMMHTLTALLKKNQLRIDSMHVAGGGFGGTQVCQRESLTVALEIGRCLVQRVSPVEWQWHGQALN